MDTTKKLVVLTVMALVLSMAGCAKEGEAAMQDHALTLRWSNTDDLLCAELVELSFTSPAQYQNPYDINNVQLEATFTLPDGTLRKVPGFWYKDYRRSVRANAEHLTPMDEGEWRIRFTPPAQGSYSYTVTLYDFESGREYHYPAQGQQDFYVGYAPNRGRLRVSKNDAAYLEFEDGTPYLGIGHNLCGWEWGGTDNRMGSYEYDRWLSAMAHEGANMAQFDFCEGDQLEWTAQNHELPYSQDWQGLGRYNQQTAWKMDARIRRAQELGIYFRLTLLHWEDFDNEVENFPDWGWNRNPYNVKNGGPARNVSDFFENKDCCTYIKSYLYYVVARWGYSNNILAYELWNELDAPEIMWRKGESYADNRMLVAQWHRKMSNYLKTLDLARAVTTSYASTVEDDNIWAMDEIDLTTVHRYTYYNTDYGDTQYDTEGALGSILQRRLDTTGKPAMIGEFALSPGGDIQKDYDHSGVEFHNQLWASVMYKSLGTAMHWTWASYIEQYNLYYHYRGISLFMKDEDLRGSIAVQLPDDELLILGLRRKEDVLLWIKNRNYTFVQQEIAIVAQGKILALENFKETDYTVQYWDTQTGKIIDEQKLQPRNDVLTLVLPAIATDIAIKILPTSAHIVWKSVDIPAPRNSAYTKQVGKQVDVMGGGLGIGGIADGCRWVYREAWGQFALTTQLDSLTNLGENTMAGLMLRADSLPGAAYAALLVTPHGKLLFSTRDTGMANWQEVAQIDMGVWLRLTSRDGAVAAHYAVDGRNWRKVGQATLPKDTLQAGMAVSSRNSLTYVTASFNNPTLQIHSEVSL